jgi:elongation factor G
VILQKEAKVVMKVYRTDEIRNVVLLGHGGCGKTSLVEAMAYVSGATNRMGKVSDGNTISDFDKEEQKRKFSVSTSLVPIEWEKAKINILDTPGYFDFVGEVEEAVSAADAAIIVVSGKAGVQVGTQKAWDLCEKYKLPRMIFVTEMDVDDVSYRVVVEQLTELQLHMDLIKIQIGIKNLLNMQIVLIR